MAWGSFELLRTLAKSGDRIVQPEQNDLISSLPLKWHFRLSIRNRKGASDFVFAPLSDFAPAFFNKKTLCGAAELFTIGWSRLMYLCWYHGELGIVMPFSWGACLSEH